MEQARTVVASRRLVDEAWLFTSCSVILDCDVSLTDSYEAI